ncbi:beta-galactosidase [Bifidobacterium sp. 82T10]|uniref:Beta-galactosidase n=1 Tax=Bifidobacterium miconis TaxID=2834435 RepID=A0ABS6WH73_9BIFI|nr:beta-galactosidase [Bifidobacterium miconis]MBW3093405.1 beta-galactosidase [Bifidobacterium miconis]
MNQSIQSGGQSGDRSGDRNSASKAVRLERGRILIDGVPRVLLCASLFPFRVPRAQWWQRLEAVKRLGYHAIDVYIPWNFHETAPGVWDFTGRHDIDAFLRMTHEAGLYAMVRPGPYICSEWDGGAIPAWVATDPARGGGEALRQNDPAFLDAVRGWYDRILPIIARRQYGHGGPVIMVQADNELDFYSCRDPRGYIGALAGMMREAGIDVPIVACAGQGDIARSGAGDAANVVVTPAVNLYADDNGVDMDAHVRYYRAAVARHGAPLIVTETNRLHRTLRRLVGNGAQFVGPFLQVSGWDFDLTTSVNNWGALESYMTHDYDFGGVIDPAGQERPDADEARRLSAIIAALGERLALADPVPDGERWHGVAANDPDGRAFDATDDADPSDGGVAIGTLALRGGGLLTTLTNVARRVATVALASDASPSLRLPSATLPAGAGVMLVHDMPLDDALTLCATNGEPVALSVAEHGGDDDDAGRVDNVRVGDDHAGVDCAEDGRTAAVTSIELSAPLSVPQPGTVWAAFAPAGGEAIAVIRQTGDVETRVENGALVVSGTDGTVTFSIDDGGTRTYRVALSRPARLYRPSCAGETTMTAVDTTDANVDAEPVWVPVPDDANGRALPMEDCGVYAGSMRYRAPLDAAEAGDVTGVVLRDAADTISVRCDGPDGSVVTPWRANGGGALYVPFTRERNDGAELEAHAGAADATDAAAIAGSDHAAERPLAQPESRVLEVTARIWGHSNFDDARLPSLRLSAKRGITGAIAVTRAYDLNSGWLTEYAPDDPAAERDLRARGLTIGDDPLPRGGLGGRTTDVWPHKLAYTRTLHAGDATAALHVEHGQTRCDVALNGRPVGALTPLTPTLWLGDIHDSDRLTVTVWRTWGENAGRMALLTGREVTGWTMAAQGLRELREAADVAFGAAIPESATDTEAASGTAIPASATSESDRTATLPLAIAPGAGQWLRIPADAIAKSVHARNTVVRFRGDGLQLTSFTRESCLGRMVLGGLPGTVLAGGRGNLFLVPEGEGDLRVWAEATRDEPGRLDAVTLGGPVDLPRRA